MNRTSALFVSLAIAVAAIAGVFALGNTLSLGRSAHASTDRQVAQRTAQLDRYEASLRKALLKKPPALPRLSTSTPATAPVQAAAPVRVVYHRPPPIIVTKHRSAGAGEAEFEGVEADD
jgi:hypothetical protein